MITSSNNENNKLSSVSTNEISHTPMVIMEFHSPAFLKSVLIFIMSALIGVTSYYLFQDILFHYSLILPIYEEIGTHPNYYIWNEENAQEVECSTFETGDEQRPKWLSINRKSGPGHAGVGFALNRKLNLRDTLVLYIKNNNEQSRSVEYAISMVEEETETNPFPEDWNYLVQMEGNQWQEVRLPLANFLLNPNYYPKGQPGNRVLDIEDVKNFTFTFFINTETHLLLDKVAVNREVIAWDSILLMALLMIWFVSLVASGRQNTLYDPEFFTQVLKFLIYITTFLCYVSHFHRTEADSHFMASMLTLSVLSCLETFLFLFSRKTALFDLALILDSLAVVAFTFWRHLEPSFFPYLYAASLLPLLVRNKKNSVILSALYVAAFLFMLYWEHDTIPFVQAVVPSLLLLAGFLFLMDHQKKKRAEAGYLSLQREHTELIQQRDQLISFVEVSFEDILDGVAFLNPIRNADGDVADFQFRRINKHGVSMLNLDPDRIPQLELNEVFATTDFSSLFERVMQVWMNGITQEVQEVKARKNSKLSFTLKIFKVNDFISIVFYDDSERIRLIQERNDLEDQLRHSQKMEAIGILAGGVAHDFNNLLTGIIGFSDLMLRKLPVNDPLVTYAKQINEIGQRGSSLTHQLLAFSRKQIQVKRVIQIQEVIINFEKMLRRLMGETIHLNLNFADEIGNVEADVNQIEQVISNLVINARDAMPDGGTVTIEIRNSKEEDLIRFPGKMLQGEYVMLSVHDQGTGMDSKLIHRIFEPFFTTKEAGKGTGLGLSTVYGIIKQSGGDIVVESTVGKGTSFYIFLPKTHSPLDMESNPKPQNAEYPGSGTILLVEDELPLLSLISSQLEMSGYKVISCADGQHALQAIRESDRPIDLLLTDIMMPKMTGKVLIDQIKEIKPSLKIIIMSGYFTHSGSHENLIAEYPYLQKPFTMSTLLKTVYECIHGIEQDLQTAKIPLPDINQVQPAFYSS